jgi:N-acetylglutamate synthase-like GNAT family acetyltransferase
VSLSARDATHADYAVFARLFPALKVPDPLPTATQFEQQMLPNVVIAEDGEPVGYVHWRFYGETAHVAHVVVDARARGRGVGRALMEEVRRRAVAHGCSRWYLNVKSDNAPAIQLYERAGLSLEQRGWLMVADWSALRALPGSTGTLRFEPSADEASQFARDHGIDPERLALVRARPGVTFAALRDEAGTCALAAFDPTFPSIYPVAVTHPGHARPLFEAFLPHARHLHVNVVVEGNAALADALRSGGAKLHFEILRMGASLG